DHAVRRRDARGRRRGDAAPRRGRVRRAARAGRRRRRAGPARPPASTRGRMTTPFTELTDLASERLGGAVIAANDQFFAEKENLLKAAAPVFLEHEYTDRGKWMDGWETRRRRTPGHDHCIVRLGLPGVVRGVVIDTAFFRGNYPDHASIEGCSARPDASPELL